MWWSGESVKILYMKAYNLLGDPSFNVRGIGYKKDLNLINHNIYSGDTVYYYANSTLQNAGNVVVYNGGDADISARTEITLQPGFEVKRGGTCHLYLHSFNRDEYERRSMVSPNMTKEENEGPNMGNLEECTVFECYPNPTSGLLNIKYKITERQTVSILLFNVYGELQWKLFDGLKEKGEYIETFNLSELASGTYFIRFVSEDSHYTKKIVKY